MAPDATEDRAAQTRNISIPSDGSLGDDLTIEFTINRQSFVGSQSGQFVIHGLGPVTRDAIYKDQFDWTQFRSIQFRAGYGTFAPRVFNGTILQAYSEKQGEDEFTTIDAFDGGFYMTNAFTNSAANAGGDVSQTARDTIVSLAASMPNIQGPAVVGNFPVANMRGEVLFGDTWGLIRQKSNGLSTINDGVVYALNYNEGLINGQIFDITTLDPSNPSIPVISADTGLLGAPRRSGIMVEWDMLFEPRLNMFQVVAIKSDFNPRFNGIYKVMGLTHRGIVSKSRNGSYVTTAKFLFGQGTFFASAAQQQAEAATG